MKTSEEASTDKKESKDSQKQTASQPAGRTKSKKEQQSQDDVLLPPAASSSTKKKKKSKRSKQHKENAADDLLPQKSTSGKDVATELLPGKTGQSPADEMLPPVAKKESIPDQPPIGEEWAEVEGEEISGSGIAESEKVLLPDGAGGFVEASERKTTVDYRGAKIELTRMKRGEKEASRSLTNFIVITFCIALLIVLMLVISWYTGKE